MFRRKPRDIQLAIVWSFIMDLEKERGDFVRESGWGCGALRDTHDGARRFTDAAEKKRMA